MVEILKIGAGSKVTTCENCASKLRYKPSEVQGRKVNIDYTGGGDYETQILCPHCKEWTTV